MRVGLSACIALAALAGCADKGQKAAPAPTVRVERVIDGDTVELTRFGSSRLIGVNAPEKGKCGDDAATRFTQRELEGKQVKYELGEEPKDRYDRTLAYLTRENKMHNLALVEEGYAKGSDYSAKRQVRRPVRGGCGASEAARSRTSGHLCPQETETVARKRARERAQERRRAARLARRLRAAERRARAAERRAARRPKKRRRGGGGSSSGSIPKNCSGVSGPIPTPPGDPTNLDGDGDGQACE